MNQVLTIITIAIEALCIKVPFFSQRLRIKVPFSEVAPCPFEILARTLVKHLMLLPWGTMAYV